MEHKAKIVKVASEYVEQEAVFEGYKLQFRDYKDGRVEFKFTNELAQAYGAKDVRDMVQKLGIQNEVAIGGVPEWITITADGIYWEGSMNNMN